MLVIKRCGAVDHVGVVLVIESFGAGDHVGVVLVIIWVWYW